ncbi:MAG: hypothetical protein ACK5MA_09480 [Parachlamydiaceae bacterium]
MKKLLLISALACALNLHADNLGTVEYSLQPTFSNWNIFEETKTGPLNTIIYTPKGVPQTETPELFVVISTNQPRGSTNPEQIRQEIQNSFPGMEVQVDMLKQDNDVTLYTWSVSKGDKALSGITKGFNTNPGTVIMTYQTLNKLTDETKANWLKVISDAHVK